MFYAILIINGLTLLIGILTGICCLRKRKAFSDTQAGYHMERATQDQESWKKANQMAGFLCILGSAVGLLIIPFLFVGSLMGDSMLLFFYCLTFSSFGTLGTITPSEKEKITEGTTT